MSTPARFLPRDIFLAGLILILAGYLNAALGVVTDQKYGIGVLNGFLVALLGGILMLYPVATGYRRLLGIAFLILGLIVPLFVFYFVISNFSIGGAIQSAGF